MWINRIWFLFSLALALALLDLRERGEKGPTSLQIRARTSLEQEIETQFRGPGPMA